MSHAAGAAFGPLGSGPVGVGIIGAGVISKQYLDNLTSFPMYGSSPSATCSRKQRQPGLPNTEFPPTEVWTPSSAILRSKSSST